MEAGVNRSPFIFTGGPNSLSRSGLTFPDESTILRVSRKKRPSADVAQLAEHLICNQAVASSILAVSSAGARERSRSPVVRDGRGGVPEWPKGSDCKSDGASLRRFESFPHHAS